MNHKYNAKILDLKPGTIDEGNQEHIIDAHMKIKIDSTEIWCFVPDWRTYFPYWPPYHPYGIGETLIKNLIGKTLVLILGFLNLKTELSEEKIKKIMPLPSRRKPSDYIIIGEVISKEPLPKHPDKYELLQVDCGFEANYLSVNKDKYKVGDYIRAEGRLDAYIVDEKQEEDMKSGDGLE